MDLGTNSVRLLLVSIEPNHSYTILQQLKETVRLGEGEFGSHVLQPRAIERAVAVVRQFATIARSAGADRIVAVATAAAREAENQHFFLHQLATEAGVDVHVVSGREEARLIYLGVASGRDIGANPALCIDIGGGSTEVIVGTQDDYQYLNSLKLGAIRLSSLFLADHPGAVTRDEYARIRMHVSANAAATIHEIREYGVASAIGSSGTIENLADITARMFFQRSRRREDVFTREQIRRALDFLCSLPLKDRVNVAGINPARADIIIGGGAILDVLMEELSIKELHISDRGLREGLLVDYLLRHGHASLVEGLSVRERSILQLGRACRFDEQHARRTARFARQLFDSAKASKLHNLGEDERELLEGAALLHHIGSFLTHTGYEKHTHYMISHAELLGFDEEEIAVIAATCLFHRGGLPRAKDPAFAQLSSKDRGTVRVLSMILRLAENLDRSRSEFVRSALLVPGPHKTIELSVEADRDCPIELSGLENQRAAFAKTFHRELKVRLSGSMYADFPAEIPNPDISR